jgi:small subunit ribosomal protein S4
MARHIGPVCRLCRREGLKLFLKGERCYGPSCAIEKRNYVPGQHGKSRRPKKLSGYGTQLREKQRVRRIYGVLERQFRNYYQKAVQMKGVVGENLLALLERRLDSVIYRIGFAASRSQARQVVRHGHIQVNGHKVDIPSYTVKPGDIIELAEPSRTHAGVLAALDASSHGMTPSWIEFDREAFRGKVTAMPRREELVQIPVNEQLIVELYSR